MPDVGLDREIRARQITDQEGVAGEHHPRLGRARVVYHGEDDVLGAVSRRCESTDAHVPHRELVAGLEVLLARLLRACGAMGERTSRRGEP